MPYYKFQIYLESLKDELSAIKKQNDEQAKQNSRVGKTYKAPKTPKYR